MRCKQTRLRDAKNLTEKDLFHKRGAELASDARCARRNTIGPADLSWSWCHPGHGQLVSPGFGTTDLFVSYTTKFSRGALKFMLSCTNVADGTGFEREDTPASVYVQGGRRTKLTASYG